MESQVPLWFKAGLSVLIVCALLACLLAAICFYEHIRLRFRQWREARRIHRESFFKPPKHQTKGYK